MFVISRWTWGGESTSIIKKIYFFFSLTGIFAAFRANSAVSLKTLLMFYCLRHDWNCFTVWHCKNKKGVLIEPQIWLKCLRSVAAFPFHTWKKKQKLEQLSNSEGRLKPSVQQSCDCSHLFCYRFTLWRTSVCLEQENTPETVPGQAQTPSPSGRQPAVLSWRSPHVQGDTKRLQLMG